MSCGPAEKMRAMADEIDALNKKAEDAVNAAIGDKLGALQEEAQDKINGRFSKKRQKPDFQHQLLKPQNLTQIKIT